MLTQLWTGTGTKLSERIIGVLFSPALAFWLLGAGAILLAHVPPSGWLNVIRRDTKAFEATPGPAQLIVVLGLVGGLTLSGHIVNSVTLPALRLLEGYWPQWLAAPRKRPGDRAS